jgi:putative endonuclease
VPSFWLGQNHLPLSFKTMNENFFGVYIMGNSRPTLYIGVTNNLVRRILEHKQGYIKGFAQKYNLKHLLYYEFCESMMQAIIREKQLKDLNRKDKLRLIERKNPLLKDLSPELFELVDDVSGIVLYEN